jgi:alpha-N-arabinofuranosidase
MAYLCPAQQQTLRLSRFCELTPARRTFTIFNSLLSDRLPRGRCVGKLLVVFLSALAGGSLAACCDAQEVAPHSTGVAVLLVDTDHGMGTVHEDVYGHFLEHINHSVVDGLFAEQIRGQGFEANDFATYWTPLAENGSTSIIDVKFANGEKSLRLETRGGMAGVAQGRIYLQEGKTYNGSAWIKPEQGTAQVRLVWKDSGGSVLAEAPLATSGSEWQEVKFSFACPKTDKSATLEIVARGTGVVLVDFVSMMLAEV